MHSFILSAQLFLSSPGHTSWNKYLHSSFRKIVFPTWNKISNEKRRTSSARGAVILINDLRRTPAPHADRVVLDGGVFKYTITAVNNNVKTSSGFSAGLVKFNQTTLELIYYVIRPTMYMPAVNFKVFTNRIHYGFFFFLLVESFKSTLRNAFCRFNEAAIFFFFLMAVLNYYSLNRKPIKLYVLYSVIQKARSVLAPFFGRKSS